MREGITRLTYQEISRKWVNKIKEIYQDMNEAEGIEELVAFLKNPAYSISFKYALCRFLREKYGVASGGENKRVFVEYESFKAFFLDDLTTPHPEEVEDYITLMLLLAKNRGMEGQFQGKLLRRYLTGKQETVSRETLFKMAFAFDMDCEVVCELLESLNEVPYQFRDPWECICYYCQFSEETNRWELARKLFARWENTARTVEETSDVYAGQSQMLSEGIARLHFEEEDLEKRQEQFLSYLEEHAGEMIGYSRSAYEVLDTLLEETKQLTGAQDDIELAIRLWEPIWVQFLTKKADKTGLNRSDFVPFKDLLDLPKTIYEKPLWRARILKLRERKVPVEKRDILFLNAMKWTLEEESEGGEEAMNEFVLETNDLLAQGGLAMIYPPNPYDRMILLAICSESPYDVLSDIFQTATDEEKLQEKLLEKETEKKTGAKQTAQK